MKALRCAIYTRKSSEEGLEQGFNSLDAQREACEAYVLSQAGEGWKALATEYDDGGFSGGNMQRPAMQRLLADIDKGLIDIVVVYKVDRLTRSLSDFSKIVERFDAKTVSFVSVTQAFNTTSSMGRLTLNMLLSFAQFEREVTGERIRDKIAASKAKGMWMGGRPPLGYDGVDHKLQVNEPEAQTVRAIFQRYLDLGSVKALTRELADAGTLSKSWAGRNGQPLGGRQFTRGAVYHLLSNPVYRGAIRHGERLYKDAHPAIIDEITWVAVRAGLAANAPAAPRTLKLGEAALLKGLLFDDEGNPMQPSHTRRGINRYHYYITPGRISDLREVGSLPRIGAPILDALVVEKVTALIKLNWRPGDGIAGRVRAALRKVILGAALVRLEILAQACRADVSGEAAAVEDIIEIKIPTTLHNRRSTKLIAAADGPVEAPAAPDRALVRAVSIARTWRRRLESGEVATTRELARLEGLCHRHTGRLLPLAYLAPDLVDAIIEGRQPRSTTLQALTANPLPIAWEEQRRLVAGFA